MPSAARPSDHLRIMWKDNHILRPISLLKGVSMIQAGKALTEKVTVYPGLRLGMIVPLHHLYENIEAKENTYPRQLS